LKPILVKLLKFGISAAIIGYLVVDAWGNETFANLANQPKHWGLLSAAWLLCMLGVVVTIVRWHLLVKALELPFSMRDAFRLGFLGYLFNFVSLGSVGGDLFKAVFLAREQHGRRAEAVATVVVDRIIGLYALFVVASFFILAYGQLYSPERETQIICRATLIGTVVGAIGIGMLMVPGFTSGSVSQWLSNLPRVGPIVARLIWAIRMYRLKPLVLLSAGVMSLAVHVLFTVGIYLAARGLPGQSPNLADHFIIVPMAMLASALPLPLNGLGAFEGVMDFLYIKVPTDVVVQPAQGFLVAIVYRVITIIIAMVGVCFYLAHRREVADVFKDAEAEEEAAEEVRPAKLSAAVSS
jgi:uncharacterized protein (TIRG00374 family)